MIAIDGKLDNDCPAFENERERTRERERERERTREGERGREGEREK